MHFNFKQKSAKRVKIPPSKGVRGMFCGGVHEAMRANIHSVSLSKRPSVAGFLKKPTPHSVSFRADEMKKQSFTKRIKPALMFVLFDDSRARNLSRSLTKALRFLASNFKSFSLRTIFYRSQKSAFPKKLPLGMTNRNAARLDSRSNASRWNAVFDALRRVLFGKTNALESNPERHEWTRKRPGCIPTQSLGTRLSRTLPQKTAFLSKGGTENAARLTIQILFVFICFCLTTNASAQAPRVTIEAPELRQLAGARVELNFRAGALDNPVQNLFGLAFELHYSDATHIVFDNPSDALAGPFLQPDVFTFTRHEPENRVFFLAVSRKRGAAGQNGDGIALTLPFTISENAPPGAKICFTIQNVAANTPDGTPLQFEAGETVCLEVIEPVIEVVPNPITPNNDTYNDEVEFKRDGGWPVEFSVRIMDRTGRIIRVLENGENKWDGRDSAGRLQLPGVYLYTIHDEGRVVQRGFLGIIL